MPVATRPRLFSAHLLPLLVVFAGLASSCQSSRPSFSFQPAPGRARAAHGPVPVANDSVVVTATTLRPAQAKDRVGTVPVVARPRQGAKIQARPVAMVTENVVARPLMKRLVAVRGRALLHRSHGTAEAGLGTTVLGVLGLIALPIAAVGLILSGGGLGWIIVGGLAALAVLVAYIDPFGRR